MGSKKKISILTLSMGHGGAEKVISLLLPELIKEYEVYLYLFYNKIHYTIPPEVKVISAYSDHANSLFRRVFSPFVIFKKYWNFLKKEKITTSISFLFRANVINGMIKNKDKNIFVVMSERNYPSKMYNSSLVRLIISKLYIKKYYNKADVLFSNSKYINEDLKNNFGVSIPTHILYNPISEPTFLKSSVEKPLEVLKVVTVGRFDEVKNHYLSIDAVAQLEQTNLTIIGDGYLRERYTQYLNEKKISNKVSLPGVSKTVIEDLVKYDVFVLSSKSEGFPNSLLEAMSVGLPVVSTNCMSGPLELLNDGQEVYIEKNSFFIAKYGLLINVDDTEGLRSALAYLRENPQARKKLSEKAIQRSKDFYIQSIYQDFKTIMKQ